MKWIQKQHIDHVYYCKYLLKLLHWPGCNFGYLCWFLYFLFLSLFFFLIFSHACAAGVKGSPGISPQQTSGDPVYAGRARAMAMVWIEPAHGQARSTAPPKTEQLEERQQDKCSPCGVLVVANNGHEHSSSLHRLKQWDCLIITPSLLPGYEVFT